MYFYVYHLNQLNLLEFKEHLHSLNLPMQWIVQFCEQPCELRLVELCRQQPINCAPVVVTRSIIIKEDKTWMIHVHGHKLDPLQCAATNDISSRLTLVDFKKLVKVFISSTVCVGQPDSKFTQMAVNRKGKFLSPQKEVVSYLDSGWCIKVDSMTYTSTVRHSFLIV